MESVTPELMKRLDLLAAKLGVAVDSIWATLVKQAGVEAQLDLTLVYGAIVVFALFIVLLLVGIWMFVKGDELSTRAASGAVLMITGGFVALVAAGICLESYCEYIRLSGNPEYWALMQIKGMLP